MIFEWDPEKNERLKKERGISFEEIAFLLGSGCLWAVAKHWNGDKYPNQKILIIDLRKESHAFVNNKPISWRSQFNLDNNEKSYQQILLDEKQKVNNLAKESQIIVSKIIKKDEKNGWFSEISPILVNVNKVETEAEISV